MRLLIVALLTAAPLVATTPDEELHARRIIVLWHDKEFDLARAQMRDFVKEHPSSCYVDQFRVMQGDLAWQQRKYVEALTAYNGIKAEDLKDQVWQPRAECLYHTQHYPAVITLLQARLKEQTPSVENARLFFYYAEALASDPKNAQEAATIYTHLADLLPDQKEALLLKTAKMQLVFSPDEALKTLTKTQAMGSSAPVAEAWKLYETGHYVDLIEKYDNETAMQQHTLVSYFVGRAHFNLGSYSKAQAALAQSLDAKDTQGSDRRQVLLLLIGCAQHLKQYDKVEALTERFGTEYSDDPSLPRMLILQAVAQKELEKSEAAQKALQDVLKRFPKSHEAESAQLELGLLQLKQNQLDESRQTLQRLLTSYSKGRYVGPAQQALAIIAIQDIESKDPDLEQLRGQIELLRTLANAEAGSKVQLALGYALEADGDLQGAQESYRKAMAGSKQRPTLVQDRAQLRLARSVAPSNSAAAMQLLQELQTRKQWSHEPVHLEAALESAKLQAKGDPKEELRLLLKAKQEFTRGDDIVSKDYQAMRRQMPELEATYQAYLMLLDARSAQLEAAIASTEGREADAQQKHEAAESLYRTLLRKEFAVSKYLNDHAQSSLQELK